MTEEKMRYSCMNDDDPSAVMVMQHNREMVRYMLEMPITMEEDLRAFCARLRARLGLSGHAVKEMLNVAVMLRRMPRLAECALEMGHLDVGRLGSIENQVSGVSDAQIAAVEQRLVEKLTPRVHDQVLPQKRTLATYAREIVQELAPEAVTKKRDQETPKASIRVTADGNYQLSATLDPLTGSTLQKVLHKLAGKKINPQTLYRALKKLIDERTLTTITQYTVVDPTIPGSVFLPGSGQHIGDTAHKVLEAVNSTETISPREDATESYAIPRSMRAFVQARDGHCRFPGCAVNAQSCQIDHVIPHSEGGATVATNLQCLCQHHHTLKTERLVHVDMDNHAVCIWTLNDGTIHRTVPDGPFAPAPARSAAVQVASVRGHTIARDIERRKQRGTQTAATRTTGRTTES